LSWILFVRGEGKIGEGIYDEGDAVNTISGGHRGQESVKRGARTAVKGLLRIEGPVFTKKKGLQKGGEEKWCIET